MLRLEDLEEVVPKCLFRSPALPWYRNGLVRAWGGLVLDEIFEVIVVDIVCGDLSAQRVIRRLICRGSYSGPIRV